MGDKQRESEGEGSNPWARGRVRLKAMVVISWRRAALKVGT